MKWLKDCLKKTKNRMIFQLYYIVNCIVDYAIVEYFYYVFIMASVHLKHVNSSLILFICFYNFYLKPFSNLTKHYLWAF